MTSLNHDLKKAISWTILDRRAELDISQKELSKKSHFSMNFISQIENQKSAPSVISFFAISQSLSLNITGFVDKVQSNLIKINSLWNNTKKTN